MRECFTCIVFQQVGGEVELLLASF